MIFVLQIHADEEFFRLTCRVAVNILPYKRQDITLAFSMSATCVTEQSIYLEHNSLT